jgi:hypothetical protein
MVSPNVTKSGVTPDEGDAVKVEMLGGAFTST